VTPDEEQIMPGIKSPVALTVFVISGALLPAQSEHASKFELVPKIVFSSTRQNDVQNPACSVFNTALELFLMDPDGTNVERWTDNEGCTRSDFFAALSPDGKKMVLDSTRPVESVSPLLSHLFVMDVDGSQLTFFTPGSSATWSSDSKYLAFMASASYYASNGLAILPPIRNQPGAPTVDSDIFVANVDDVFGGAAPKNVTNSDQMIDEDADWSPDGAKIAFTSDPASDYLGVPLPGNPFNYPTKEIFVINPDGTGLTQLTFNDREERGPAWSPDGTRIAFIGRVGKRGGNTFELCVMNADGSNQVQLTDNALFEGTMTWTPDGEKIIFQTPGGANPTLLLAVDADTTCDTTKPVTESCTCSAGVGAACVTKLTTDGVSLFPHLGQLRLSRRR
jgi:Tol biopolymer transport system component